MASEDFTSVELSITTSHVPHYSVAESGLL